MKTNEKIISLYGRIDSGNATQVEESIFKELGSDRDMALILDAKDLQYISSAGLRVILRLKKAHSDLSIINVNSDIYEILDMTGFTEMMNVTKAYRVVSIEGCEEIGRGANGTIYRIDHDNVVKVYKNADALKDIQHEREVAKLALILGIPTAISYDVVKVGDSYGSVFELLNARSFSKILAAEPEKINWCVNEYVKMLKKIHSTEVPVGKLPEIKDTVLNWASFVKDYLPEDLGNKLYSMIEAVPDDNHMIHGDYHTKNLELQGDEVLLIDMDTLATGNPIFELGSIYNAFVGFGEADHSVIKKFQGFDFETGVDFWQKFMREYLNTDNEAYINEVMDKARVIGYTRMIRRSIRRGGLDDEAKRAEIELWQKELTELLNKYDDLQFDRAKTAESPANELDIEAVEGNLGRVLEFVTERLDKIDCPMKEEMQIEVAVEEVFVNIASYAYHPDKGNATVRVEVFDDPVTVAITFIDHGVPYDPLEREDPDITLKAEDRPVGGLGIFMVKKTMDEVTYEYKEGKNILRLKKKI